MASRKKKYAPSSLRKSVLGICAVLIIAAAAVVLDKFGLLTDGQTAGTGKKKTEAVNADTTVEFIDVGQGDSTLVCSDGEYMLIDTGDRDSGNTVINYLKDSGVERLEYLILTHPHADHIGEAAEIAEEFEIGKVIAPNVPDDLVPTSAVYENLLDAMEEKDLKFRAARDESFELGECTAETFAPHGDYSNINNYSVLVKITHGENSFLITGDCEVQEEREFLERGCDLSADVLKAAHHGSDTSSSSEWLSAVMPQYTVISCGVDNKYGHPDDETYTRICKYSPKVYITAEDGTVVFESDGKGISVKESGKR